MKLIGPAALPGQCQNEQRSTQASRFFPVLHWVSMEKLNSHEGSGFVGNFFRMWQEAK